MTARLTRIELERTEFMPKDLKPGILYVSEEYGAAAHLCACGCGEKVRTPLSPTGWQLFEGARGPTLIPSVGNWQKPCRSHYWIEDGGIEWAGDWSEAQVAAGRRAQDERDRRYYAARDRVRGGLMGQIWRGLVAFVRWLSGAR